MADSSVNDDFEMESAFNDILKNEADRSLMSEQLLSSISYCEETGSAAWAVSKLPRGLRLNVGQVEVLSINYTNIDAASFNLPEDQQVLDFRLLISGDPALSLIESIGSEILCQEMHYRSVAGRHWCVNICLPLNADLSDQDRISAIDALALFKTCHRHYVKSASFTATGKLRKRSNFAQHNCPAIVAYARKTMGEPVN